MKSLNLLGFILLFTWHAHAGGLFKSGSLSQCPIVPQAFCTDDSGNAYAAEVRDADHVDIYKWDKVQWRQHITVQRDFGNYFVKEYGINLLSLHDTLYLNVSLVQLPNVTALTYQIKNNTYKRIAISNDRQQYRYLMKQNGRLVYTGYYDTVNSLRAPYISSYRNGQWSSLNNPAGLYPYEPLLWDKGDTVFVWAFSNITFGRSLYRVCGDSQWSVVMKSPVNARYSVPVQLGNRVLMVWEDSIIELGVNGEVLDRTHNRFDIERLFVFNGKLIGINENYGLSRFYIFTGGDFKLFYQSYGTHYPETNVLYANNNKLYLLSDLGTYEYGGENYGHIAEVHPDSIKALPMDTICGTAFFDANDNGLLDAGESGVKARIRSASNPFETIETDDSGRYTFYVPWYETAELDFIPFALDSCHIKSFNGYLRARNTDPGISRDTLNFSLRLLSRSKEKVRVYNASAFAARIDDTIVLQFRAYNPNCSGGSVKGASAEIVLDSGMQVVWAGQGGVAQGHSVRWSNLNIPNATGTDLQVAVRYPFNRYTRGDNVLSTVYLQTLLDADTLLTEAQIVQRMIYSYDPNVKQCQPSGITHLPVDVVHYRIDFQNEGNDIARKVVVRDTVSHAFSLAEMQMLGCSHAYVLSKRGNVLEWQIPSANLQPRSVSESQSKGYLSFALPLKAGMQVGDSLLNRAFIYFDKNEPVVTPYALLTRQELSGLDLARPAGGSLLYPNPATDKLYVQHYGTPGLIRLYSMYGTLLMQTYTGAGDLTCMDIARLGRGLYIIQLPGGHTEKLILH